MDLVLQFLLAVLVLMLIPGPDMAYVAASGIAYGSRGALVAALGIGSGGLVLTATTAAVVAAAATIDERLMTTIQLVGCVYLLYLAVRTILPPADGGGAAKTNAPSHGDLFLRGVVTNVANPKALVFFLAFIPQFVPADAASPALAALLLGVLLCAVGTTINFLIGVSGAALGRFTGRVVLGRSVGQWVVAGVFGAIAISYLGSLAA